MTIKCVVVIGAREPEVEEPVLAAKPVLFEFEMDEVTEPKGLLSYQLRILVLRNGSYAKTANSLDTSETFIRQNARACPHLTRPT